MLRALEAAERGETVYAATVLPTVENQSPGFARVILREDGTIFFATADLMRRRCRIWLRWRVPPNEAKPIHYRSRKVRRAKFFSSRFCRRNDWRYSAPAMMFDRWSGWRYLLGWRVTVCRWSGRGWPRLRDFREAERTCWTLSEKRGKFCPALPRQIATPRLLPTASNRTEICWGNCCQSICATWTAGSAPSQSTFVDGDGTAARLGAGRRRCSGRMRRSVLNLAETARKRSRWQSLQRFRRRFTRKPQSHAACRRSDLPYRSPSPLRSGAMQS